MSGKVVQIDAKRGECMFLVEFDTAFPGGGIDEKKLWISADYLEARGARGK